MNAVAEPDQDLFEGHEVSPPVGCPVLVQFADYRCVAILSNGGKWKSHFSQKELKGKIVAWSFLESWHPAPPLLN
jgi:hypothetical protein